MIVCDSKGGLHKGRKDIRADKRFYRKWEICEATNPKKVNSIEEAMKGADVLIVLSTPGPDVIKPAWVSSMAKKSIVFACANPCSGDLPLRRERGRGFIVAKDEGRFPKPGQQLARLPRHPERRPDCQGVQDYGDEMAIAAAYSMAKTAEKNNISPEYIVPLMSEWEIFPAEARDVAMQAIKDGVARVQVTAKEAFKKAEADIKEARELEITLMDTGYIKKPPMSMLRNALQRAIDQVK